VNRHTFLVLAHKESPYLESCIKSLISQTLQSDILICTSTPSDFISDIAQRFKLALKINPNQQGMGADWEFAYNQAATPYLTLAHQDDEYLPHYTQTLLGLAEQYPTAHILFSNYAEIVAGDWQKLTFNLLIKRMLLRLGFGFSSAIRSSFFKKLTISFGNPICCPAVIYNKAQIGALSFPRQSRFVLDWEIWLELSQRPGSFVYTPKCLMGHRIHKASETSQLTNSGERELEEQAVFKKIWGEALAKPILALYALSHFSNQRAK